MSGVKSLAKDTVVYGLSSILGRFLNWCLVPLYTQTFLAEEYGVVTYIYSYVALVLVVLIYGMETGFFRFANHERYPDPMVVYSTSLVSLATTSSLFIIGVLWFVTPLSYLLHSSHHTSYIALMGAAVALDAFTAMPFSYLRYRHRAMRFATLKCLNIGLNIGLNLFFILLCPWLWKVAPATIDWFYDPTFGIGYIFLANFISSLFNLVVLYPELRGFKWRFDFKLWKEMIVYSLPLLVLGVAGIMNQTIDKILLPGLVADPEQGMTEVGIYGANYKIAIVMVMFIQAFRFAYEPFIFAQNKERGESRLQGYRDAMKWFVIFAMVIFLVVMFYLDFLRYFIASDYFSGLKVVPVIMIAEFFFGVFFNLSLWYKLTDRTHWGMWFSLLGLGVTVALNVLLVPHIGYMGCAWAALACYGVMMVTSYAVGRVKYPIGYGVGRLTLYFLTALMLYGVSVGLHRVVDNLWIEIPVRTLMLCAYLYMVMRVERLSFRSITRLIPKRHRIVQ
ncbi:MAG: oligosaccharide flippase family protein [Paramuribaculum sp.]|nr:oligosaccharide flippase family protein [Paramuribaculum sp.]